jgi:hypothetical protein
MIVRGRYATEHLRTANGGKLKLNSLMSKSKTANRATQALRRHGQSVLKKSLDREHRFIDEL